MGTPIAEPLTLKCGIRLENRLVKAAMTEQMSDENYLPTEIYNRAYGKWAEGQWGMVILGHVIVNTTYLGGARDTAVDPANEAEIIRRWTSWAAACTSHKTPTIMQINHPGKQSPLGSGRKGFWAKNPSPSAVPLKMGESLLAKAITSLLFGTPREMSVEEIEETVRQFVYVAKLAAKTGFDGVEIHAAHGYLLAQFLSPRSNRRTDAYGGSPAKRAKVIVDIITAVRKEVPEGFCVGIKLNSVDHQEETALRECLEQLKCIVDAGVDFLEISGGTYEDPQMSRGIQPSPERKTARTKAREAFFLDFAAAIRSSFPSVPLIVTGGFRTRVGMKKALEDGDCDMIGLARPAVIHPTLPRDVILNEKVADEDAVLEVKRIDSPWLAMMTGIKGIGSGTETTWYSGQIKQMGMKV